MMKRNLLFAAIFAMVMFAGLSVKAQDSVFSYAYQGTTLYYIIDTNQQARVVPPLYPDVYYYTETDSSSWYGYTKPKGAVVVPDIVLFNGGQYPVTALEAFAFYQCDSVTSVTLPVSVTYLEHDAFTECSLETITMPGVTFMGEGCFYKASSLTSLDIPAGVTELPEWLFGHCISLQSVTLPDGITHIGDMAFLNCSSLQSITLPDSLTSIGDYTFYQCSGLQSISFPDGLTTIGYAAFYQCSGLQSISLPDGLTTIGDYAFSQCSGLQSISLPDGLTTIGNYAFGQCTSLHSVDIPGSVNTIHDWAFNKCSSLVSVTLHEGLDTIGFCAFRECSSLTTVNYPSTLVEIDSFAFQYDSMLTTPAIFTDGLTSLGILVYGDCARMTTASLPGSIGEVPDELFFGCTSLKTVTLGDGITAIHKQAFNLCPNIDTFFVNCTVPPVVDPFFAFYQYNSVIVVPCDHSEDYMNDQTWGMFSEIIEDCGVGIPGENLPEVTIRVANSRIEIEGADGETVRVFDITGRLVRNEALSAGVYLVQIGNRPAEKVMVHPNM